MNNNIVLLFALLLILNYLFILSTIHIYKTIRFKKAHKKYIIKNLIYILVSVFLVWMLLIIGIIKHKIVIYSIENSNAFFIIFIFVWFTLISSLGILCFIDYMEHNKNKRVNYIIQNIYYFIFPALSFVVLEIMLNSNVFCQLKYMIGNLLIYYSLLFSISSISKNKSLNLALFGTISFIFGGVNYFVTQFRGSPILATDVLSLRTGLSVSQNYYYNLSVNFLIGMSLYQLQMLSICLIIKKYKIKNKLTNYLQSLLKYFLLAIICILFANNRMFKFVIDNWAPQTTYCSNGTALSFYNSLKNSKISKPEGYSLIRVNEIINQNESKKTLSYVNEQQPNIIAIMCESFSDLSILKKIPTSEDYLPFIHSLTKNTIKGNLLVSIYGGNTCNTEFEFLSGNSMAFFPQGSVPYQQYITKKISTIASTLKTQNYTTTAIHPFGKYGFNRNRNYPLLGLDTFYSMDDFVNPKLIRSFISDEDSFKKIIEVDDENKYSSNFIFNVTMQNHGGYTGTAELEDKIRLTDKSVNLPDLEEYLTLVHATDKAFEKLINYYKKSDKPTIILLFGDHQPELSKDSYNYLYGNIENEPLEKQQKKYMVPFVIWANYDIEEKDSEIISANYLSSYFLNIAQMKTTPYNEFLMNIRNRIPAINKYGYLGDDGKWYSIDQKTQYSNDIKEYQYIQYNNIFDKTNKMESFFQLVDTK